MTLQGFDKLLMKVGKLEKVTEDIRFSCYLYLQDIYFYYINTSEIPSELSHENFISSHVKIICYLHM